MLYQFWWKRTSEPSKSDQSIYNRNHPGRHDFPKSNLLDYSSHQSHYKLNGRYLSRQTNTSVCQKISFIGKLEVNDGAAMSFIAEKQQKTILNFLLLSVTQ